MKLGIYEKALPKAVTWHKRLTLAKELGFDFVELSIDESDARLARLDWTKKERAALRALTFEMEMPFFSMCLSAHRRFPLGANELTVQKQALAIMQKAITLASDLGIRTIQLAGYDVYYEEKSVQTRNTFVQNLTQAVAFAAENEVVLALEIMDDPFLNSITKFLTIKQQIPSPYLQVYPDLGNLSAWPENDVGAELEKGLAHLAAVHIKDTLAVTETFSGQFKNVPFGTGCVDFLGCFQTLKRLHYHAPFVLEMWSETEANPEQAIRQAQQVILPQLKEAGYTHE